MQEKIIKTKIHFISLLHFSIILNKTSSRKVSQPHIVQLVKTHQNCIFPTNNNKSLAKNNTN